MLSVAFLDLGSLGNHNLLERNPPLGKNSSHYWITNRSRFNCHFNSSIHWAEYALLIANELRDNEVAKSGPLPLQPRSEATRKPRRGRFAPGLRGSQQRLRRW